MAQSSRPFRSFSIGRSAVLLVIVFILLGTKTGQGRATATPLNFFKNYFITGDYLVKGMGFKGSGVNGFATKQISFDANAAPVGAQPVAAYLYWSTVVAQTDPAGGLTGTEFNQNPLAHNSLAPIAKALVPNGTTPCWSSGGGTAGGNGQGSKSLIIYRADVLRFLAQDADGNALINNTSYTVRLPDSGGGNSTPFTLGASLVLVYRTLTNPLRAVVLYDGGFTINNGTDSLVQPIAGFYDASHADPKAKATFIVGDGQSNFPENLRYSDNLNTTPQLLSSNPFSGADGNSWDDYALPLSTGVSNGVPTGMSPGASSATITIDQVGFPSADCITGGAFVMSMDVQDTDGDGLLDAWEKATAEKPVLDPQNQPLPPLADLGADPCRKDLFVELGYFQSSTPWPATSPQMPAPGVHGHLPSLAVLNMAAEPFKNAPVSNTGFGCTPPPGWATGIAVHFDAGNINQSSADVAIIPATLARGGEVIEEADCAAGVPCQFPGYRGVVGWKTGFQNYKDAGVVPDPPYVDSLGRLPGTQLTVQEEIACEPNCARRRFDRNRKDMFHYLLFAHALGIPKNFCLSADGTPIECSPGDPDFHTPRRNGGAGDKPGGDALITVGLWKSVSDFALASIITHELGHNLWRDHSGDPFTPFEPNCNPNYLSVMNYLFEIDGLKKEDGVPRIDFSGQALGSLKESSLPSGLGPLPYRMAWYALKSTVDQSLGTTIAKSRCDGTNPQGAEMIRIEGTTLNTLSAQNPSGIETDWNGDLNLTNDVGLSQDISFNGVTNSTPLRGSEDWTPMANYGLRQVAGRRSLAGLSLDTSKFDGSKFDGSKFDGSKFDGSKFDGSKFDGSAEQDYDTVIAVGHPAHSLKAAWNAKTIVVDWKAPNAVQPEGISAYLLYRVDGLTVTPDNFKKKTLVASTLPTQTTVTDTKVTIGKSYTYFVIVKYGDGSQSPMSNQANPK